MPRIYKPDPQGKKYKKYSEEQINEAVKAYKSGKESLKVIAQRYNIDKSVLYRHSTQTLKKHGGQTVLSEEVELYMIKYINVCGDWGYPFDALDLRYIVKNYLDKCGRKVLKFKNNLPGLDFATSFLKRHNDKISQRIILNIKKNRAKVAPDTIKKYFEELEMSLTGVDPKNIINYDETNLTDHPGNKKILVKRGTKYPERVMNHSKGSISLMMSASADGALLPPYVVYKAQNVYDTWTANDSTGARYNSTESGWFDSHVFEDWIKTIVLPYFEGKEGKKCLIGDNLSSHLSLEVIELCKNQNIHFIFLPSNSTHLTQPLDVAFFRPMKIAWRNIMLKWKITDGKAHTSISKECFPKLLKKLMEELHNNSESNIKSAFRKTGICPIDLNQVLSRLPAEQNMEQEKRAVDQSVLDMLKDMGYSNINISEPKRKKKLNIIAGRSVCTDSGDDEETEEDVSLEKNKKQKISQMNKNVQINNSDEKEDKNSMGNEKETKKQVDRISNNENAYVHEENVNVLATENLDYLEEVPLIFEDSMLCGKEIVIGNEIDDNSEIDEPTEDPITMFDTANTHPNTYKAKYSKLIKCEKVYSNKKRFNRAVCTIIK